MKDPGIAAVLSFFATGLGQIYNGQLGKGLLLIVAGFLALLSMFIFIGWIIFPVLWIWNIYDAYKTAERINRENTRNPQLK